MDLQQLLATLEGIENGAEMVRTVKSLVDEIGKKNREAKNLRVRAKKAEDRVAALNDKLSRVAVFIGLEEAEDLDSALEALKQKQWQAGDGKGQPSSEIAWIRNQLNQLQQEMKNLSAEREAFVQAAQEKIGRIDVLRDLALQKSLTAGKAVKPVLLSKILQDDVKLVLIVPT